MEFESTLGLARIFYNGKDNDAGLGTNFGVTLMGDVTYRRHVWKIECENWGKFADTVFRVIRGSRFENSRFEDAVQHCVKIAKMNVPVRNQRGVGIESIRMGANDRLGLVCVVRF